MIAAYEKNCAWESKYSDRGALAGLRYIQTKRTLSDVIVVNGHYQTNGYRHASRRNTSCLRGALPHNQLGLTEGRDLSFDEWDFGPDFVKMHGIARGTRHRAPSCNLAFQMWPH